MLWSNHPHHDNPDYFYRFNLPIPKFKIFYNSSSHSRQFLRKSTIIAEIVIFFNNYNKTDTVSVFTVGFWSEDVPVKTLLNSKNEGNLPDKHR